MPPTTMASLDLHLIMWSLTLSLACLRTKIVINASQAKDGNSESLAQTIQKTQDEIMQVMVSTEKMAAQEKI